MSTKQKTAGSYVRYEPFRSWCFRRPFRGRRSTPFRRDETNSQSSDLHGNMHAGSFHFI